jgi:hypothetical protein
MSGDMETSPNRLRGCEWLEGRNCRSPSGPHVTRALMGPARLVDGEPSSEVAGNDRSRMTPRPGCLGRSMKSPAAAGSRRGMRPIQCQYCKTASLQRRLDRRASNSAIPVALAIRWAARHQLYPKAGAVVSGEGGPSNLLSLRLVGRLRSSGDKRGAVADAICSEADDAVSRQNLGGW